MKIGLDIRSLLAPKTGVGYYTYHLANSLLKLDEVNEYHLFYFNFLRRKNSLNFKQKNAFIKEIKAVPGRVCNQIWRYFDFPKIDLFTKEMDVFHFPNFTITPLKKGKVILTVHDLSFVKYPQFTEPKNLKFLKKLFIKSINRADLILTVSEFTKNELQDVFNIKDEKIAVVYNGVEDIFKNKIDAAALKKVKLKYSLPEKYIFHVGMLEPRKNITSLIKAYHLSRGRHKDFPYKLVIVGRKGWHYEQIFATVKNLDLQKEVIFTGYVEHNDLPLLYQGGDLLVYPSIYEGFGLPVLEAMASGIPVICSAKSSLPEVAGEAALLCSGNTPEDISLKIEEVLNSEQLPKEMAAQGIRQAEKFSWEKSAQKVLALYKQLAGT